MAAPDHHTHQYHNHSFHCVIKEMSDKLRPELVRLHHALKDKNANKSLYLQLIDEIGKLRTQITNHDTLFALQNAVNHLKKAVDEAERSEINQEVLWHLQEVMALFFKIQNLPR